MALREYSGNAKATTLSGAISAAATSIAVVDGTGYPTGAAGPFVVTVDTGLAGEEKVLCLSRTGNTLTVSARGWDGTAAAAHANGAAVQHTFSATDAREANTHVNDTTGNPHPQYLQAASATPAGALLAYGGAVAPTGWLLCNGSNVSRATYAALFTAVGTTFGAGDGSTTFTLPDARGKMLLGVSASYGLASTGGAATVTLTAAQMPAHTHTATTGTDGNHDHSFQGTLNNTGSGSQNAFLAVLNDSAGAIEAAGGAGNTPANLVGGVGSSGSHTHTVTNSSAGGGTAHENLPPYLAVSMIIKT